VHSATGEVERDANGELVRILGTSQDVTERKRWEEQLVAAKEAAEEASRLKSAFLSTMSHELRTPLTAIMGYSNLLLAGIGGDLTPRQAADVGLIAAGADRLLALINDVLDLTRLGAGMLTLEPAAVDLAALVDGVAAEVAPQAAAKALAIAIDVPPGLVIRADPLRLHQVLLNLVGNAVKFTEAGRIAITARRGDDRVEIAVADTGIGIAPHALPRVFDEFRQADESTTRRFGGSGLGLAIARRLVELHGGTIRAESTPGVGSVFTVVLPVAAGGEQGPGPADAASHPADRAEPSGTGRVAGQANGAPSAAPLPGRPGPLS
jgi:signal transduction histidine kinase